MYGFHLSIQAQDALALHARGVNTGAFVSTGSRSAEATALKRPLVLIEGSGLALFKTRVSGHAGYGVQAKFMNDGTERCGESPVCPFSNFVYLEDVVVTTLRVVGSISVMQHFGLHRIGGHRGLVIMKVKQRLV